MRNANTPFKAPTRVHPNNPKCFEFRGKPLVLVTATEHYGAVLNRPFRFEKYLADERELGDPHAGEPIAGTVGFKLPDGEYEMAHFSPVSGLYSPAIGIQGGTVLRFTVPTFQHDLVVRVKRRQRPFLNQFSRDNFQRIP